MQNEHGGDDFTVVGVTQSNPQQAAAFAAELDANYPILANANASFSEWGVRFIPQAYLVDPDGRVVAEGEADIAAFLKARQ